MYVARTQTASSGALRLRSVCRPLSTSLNGIATMATRGWSKSATVWVIVALEVKRASSSRWTTMLLPARLVMRLRLSVVPSACSWR